MDFKIVWSLSARFDLKDIISFIAEDKPEAAKRFGDRIISYVEQVSRFPKSGRIVPEFDDETLRELIFSSYRIIYRVRDELGIIEVVRIWHSARGLPEITPSTGN